MNAPTLAEIIEGGKRLSAVLADASDGIAQVNAEDGLIDFYLAHGPLLLAVAEDAGRFREPAEEWLKLLDDPDKVSGAMWTRMNEAREQLFAHFHAPPPEPEP